MTTLSLTNHNIVQCVNNRFSGDNSNLEIPPCDLWHNLFLHFHKVNQ